MKSTMTRWTPTCRARTKFRAVAPNMCGSSAWYLLRVTLLAPRILRRLPVFSPLKICVPLMQHTSRKTTQ